MTHLEGAAAEMTDPEDLRAHLFDLTHTLEAGRRDGGAERTFDQVACAPMEEPMPLIVGFQIPVVSMQVKAKLGQNHSAAPPELVAKLEFRLSVRVAVFGR